MEPKNAFALQFGQVEYNAFWKQACHMSIEAGYTHNYLPFKSTRDPDGPLQYEFIEPEARKDSFLLYEISDEVNTYKGEKHLDRTADYTIQIVIPEKVMKRSPKVKEDLELLCGRTANKAPDWVTAGELPVPIETAKPGCLGYWFNRIVGDF